jgi:hypothetical protein
VVGDLLHQKTLRPVVGAEGEDAAFAVSFRVSIGCRGEHPTIQKLIEHALSDTYKLFNAIQSLSGTMPYQQLPAQLIWSQRQMPPMLRLTSGLARVVVVVRKRVASNKGSMVGLLIGLVDELEMCRWRSGGCGVLAFTTRFLPVARRMKYVVDVASLIIESIRCLVFVSVKLSRERRRSWTI